MKMHFNNAEALFVRTEVPKSANNRPNKIFVSYNFKNIQKSAFRLRTNNINI